MSNICSGHTLNFLTGVAKGWELADTKTKTDFIMRSYSINPGVFIATVFNSSNEKEIDAAGD